MQIQVLTIVQTFQPLNCEMGFILKALAFFENHKLCGGQGTSV